MGDETEIARNLEAMGIMAVYVPTSRVYHRVRQDQLSLRWQVERGFAYGRLLAHLDGRPSASQQFGLPRWLNRKTVAGLVAAARSAVTGREQQAFDQLMGVAVAVGRAKTSGGS